jgi:hypothetical protein
MDLVNTRRKQRRAFPPPKAIFGTTPHDDIKSLFVADAETTLGLLTVVDVLFPDKPS